MEGASYNDIWDNYLAYKRPLRELIIKRFGNRPPEDRLITDLALAALFCRLQYRRYPERLPAPDDVQGQAELWKKRYNTIHGKGTEEEYESNYKRFEDKK